MRTVALLVLALVAVAACDRGHDRVDTPAAERAPQGAVSDELLRALGEAQNLHHAADVHHARGELDQAIEAVRKVLDVPFPLGAPEADEVRLDARARLGLLLVEAGRLDEAEAIVDEGLRQHGPDSFIRANLHQVRGKLWEARGNTREAILSYERYQEMNFRVQDRLFKEARP
jgi:tetratricopeptide (TPR) repeat protein